MPNPGMLLSERYLPPSVNELVMIGRTAKTFFSSMSERTVMDARGGLAVVAELGDELELPAEDPAFLVDHVEVRLRAIEPVRVRDVECVVRGAGEPANSDLRLGDTGHLPSGSGGDPGRPHEGSGNQRDDDDGQHSAHLFPPVRSTIRSTTRAAL